MDSAFPLLVNLWTGLVSSQFNTPALGPGSMVFLVGIALLFPAVAHIFISGADPRCKSVARHNQGSKAAAQQEARV